MSNANSSSIELLPEDTAVKAVNKRYEGLVTVRSKAVKGKGAWYWAHLEPILIRNPETNSPKSVRLRCTLCDSAFSASNPSRTASEHLKRGTCPNFTVMLKPISQLQLPPLASPSGQQSNRKRSSQLVTGNCSIANPINMVEPKFFPDLSPKPMVLSGGRDDLNSLARLEDSVKKLKSPKASPSSALNKEQIETAFDFLAGWLFESNGPGFFSSLKHPKFKAFLNQVGLPAVSKIEFLHTRLDSKFEEARIESEARIRDSAFFQVSSDGWKNDNLNATEKSLVKFTLNLPNGTRVFNKAVYLDTCRVPSEYAEDVFSDTIRGLCGNNPQRCVGIVADKFKSKALKNLEVRNHWMVNLSCQHRGFLSLIKDFFRELPLFRTVSENCLKIANLVNSTSHVRSTFHKFKLQGVEFSGFIRVPPSKCDVSKNFNPFLAMIEDILSYSRVLHLVVLDDSYKIFLQDPRFKEIAEMVREIGFWNEVEASHSLIKLVTGMVREIESENLLIGQCLPLWEELRRKVRDWCGKYGILEGPAEKIVEKRFRKNYHPAWSAAFILDPLYLVKDSTGKYLPPFKCLTNEQEKDVEKLLARLVSREEIDILLMELIKWRAEGLEPLYAQAVQVKNQDPLTGKMKIANPQSSRLVWETCLKEFKSLSKVAVRLIFLNATSGRIKIDPSFERLACGEENSRVELERAKKLVFVAAHAKLERRDFAENDDEIFGGEYDAMNEVLEDTSSM